MGIGPSSKIRLMLQESLGAERLGMAVAKAKQLFNPSSPIDESRLFSGRTEQVRDLLDIVYERGAHAVIFGERGVGKSSLANTLSTRVPSVVTNMTFKKGELPPGGYVFHPVVKNAVGVRIRGHPDLGYI